jgi:hypothetical protein
MIFPNVSVEDWCEQYPGLSRVAEECPDCGRLSTPTIPYISHNFVGITCPPCPCGNEGPFRVFQARSKEMKEKMNNIVKNVSEIMR